MVPRWYRVVSHPDVDKYDLSSVFNVGSGGAPTSPEIQSRLREVFPRGGANMGLGYGLSESVAVISQIGGAELRLRPESVGREAKGGARDAHIRPIPPELPWVYFVRYHLVKLLPCNPDW